MFRISGLCRRSGALALATLSLIIGACSANPTAPAVDSAAAAAGKQTAVFAGGCFWGVEAVFEHLKGVEEVVSGYAGGSAVTARYELVGTGTTGHAESVRVVFDPTRISYEKLLQVYFLVAHDPTQRDRQGPDVGSQYRSAIFYTDDTQKRVAEATINQLQKTGIFRQPIVTQVVPLKGFYAAEDYHQDYLKHHPDQPYIVFHDLPKLAALKKQFPSLYRG